jgi:translation initiation factor 2 alpha subunit (eIF-2alpha)
MSYYETDYPSLNEVVFVIIEKFTNDAIYCRLVEYDNKQGFLPITELDKKVQPNPKKHFTEKKVYPMIVMNVDIDKGVIDVSYRRIKECDREKYLEKFDYFSKIFRLTREISLLSNILMDNILPLTMWKVLQKDTIENSKEIYDMILDNPSSYMENIVTDKPMEAKILENIESRITRTQMTIHQEFDLIIACNGAIDVLKNILNYSDDNLIIEYVNAPKYRIVVNGKTEQECDITLQKCIHVLKERTLNSHKIMFKIGNKTVVKERELIIKYLTKNQNIIGF